MFLSCEPNEVSNVSRYNVSKRRGSALFTYHSDEQPGP